MKNGLLESFYHVSHVIPHTNELRNKKNLTVFGNYIFENSNDFLVQCIINSLFLVKENVSLESLESAVWREVSHNDTLERFLVYTNRDDWYAFIRSIMV